MNEADPAAIRFVLVRPQYGANIGAAARAIKTMGFRQLWLVAPRQFPHPDAVRLATEAIDVLESARVVDALDEALVDCQLVIAASARPREGSWPTLDCSAAAEKMLGVAGPVALLFGPEDAGLTSAELYRAQYRSCIDIAADCHSLNLAQAVQVYAHELRRAGQHRSVPPAKHAAVHQDLEHFYAALEAALVALDFPRRDPAHLMRRFRRLFNRAELTDRELRLLHGLIARVRQRLSGPAG